MGLLDKEFERFSSSDKEAVIKLTTYYIEADYEKFVIELFRDKLGI